MQDDAFPDVLRIESSSLCNFRCTHCPTSVKKDKRGMLSVDAFFHVMDQLAARDFVPRVVVLYHGGEPLLNENLPLFIAFLKRLGVQKTVITTNASLLTPDMAKALLLAGLDEMKVSFDGLSPEENNAIRRRGDFFRDAAHLKGLLALKRAFRLRTPVVRVCNVQVLTRPALERLDLHEAHEGWTTPPEYLREFFADYMDDLRFQCVPALKWPGYAKEQDLDVVPLRLGALPHCVSLFETCSILANGDVVPCCNDLNGEKVFGNVFASTVFDIWASEAFAAFRAGFRNKRYDPFCVKCPIVTPLYLARPA